MNSETTTQSYLAVCFKCSYCTYERESVCPECSFPLILQAEATPPGGFDLQEILHRSSLRVGAPPLPGVDAEPRQAQKLAEMRRRRRQEKDQAEVAEAPPASEEFEAKAAPTKRSAARFALVCFSAVAAGVLAAVLNSGL